MTKKADLTKIQLKCTLHSYFYEPKQWEKQRSEIQTEKRGQAHRYDDKQGPNKKRADTQADSHIENERPHLAINSYSKLLLNTYCNIISLLKLG